jgi:hypothetical protein
MASLAVTRWYVYLGSLRGTYVSVTVYGLRVHTRVRTYMPRTVHDSLWTADSRVRTRVRSYVSVTVYSLRVVVYVLRFGPTCQ